MRSSDSNALFCCLLLICVGGGGIERLEYFVVHNLWAASIVWLCLAVGRTRRMRNLHSLSEHSYN